MRLLIVSVVMILLAVGSGCIVNQPGGAGRALFTDASNRGDANRAIDSTIIRARSVLVNFDLISVPHEPSNRQAKPGSVLWLNLFEDASFTAVLDRGQVRSESSFIWIGHIEGTRHSQVTLVVEDGVMAGNIRVPGAFYQVRYAGSGVHIIYEINQDAFPPDSQPVRIPGVSK